MTKPKLNRETALQIRAVGELLADPTHRCIDVYARDAQGRCAHQLSPAARSWCLSAACEKVVGFEGEPGGRVYNEVVRLLSDGNSYTLPYYWERTDDAGREEIVQKLLTIDVPE